MKNTIIGLGTGRCGSMSLTNLLSFQGNCLVSHEIGGRPWLPWKRDTKPLQIRKAFNWDVIK
jgi:hypothetical protein